MKFIVHRKKKTNECDGCAGGDMSFPVYPDADAPIGMGPVNPMGGPDRWDMGFRFDSSTPKKRVYRVKRRRK